MKNRVVITGLGIVSPIGNTPKTAYENAIHGVNGIETITNFSTEDLKVKIAAQVKDFEPTKHLSKQDIRRQDLFSQYAVYAAIEAFEDAQVNVENIDMDRVGVIIGTGMGGMNTFANTIEKTTKNQNYKVAPMFIPMIIPNMAAGNVSIALGAKGYSTCVTTACAAGTHAIGDGYRLIQNGEMDMMIVGGSEAGISPYTLAGFNALTALSTSEDPNKASRPFDIDRDGFVLGEGAGILILESLEHALNRKATIYGEVVGYGATSDAYHITSPSGDGAKKAIQKALEDANLSPTEVDYINAHGTSTPINDVMESKAIEDVFGSYAKDINISSTKSMHGHALGGTGGIEAVLTVLTLQNGVIPPTINLENIDPECSLNYTPQKSVHRDIKTALTNSLGFGGHNAVLAFRKADEEWN